MPRIVLDPVAVADLPDHLEIEHRALVQPLRLEHPSLVLEEVAALGQLGLDRLGGVLEPIAGGDEVRLRVDGDALVAAQRLAGDRIEGGQLVHLVAEQPDPHRRLVVGRVHLDDVAAHPEGATPELEVVAFVEDFDQLAQQVVARGALALFERQHQAVVGLGRAQAVDAADAGDDDDVAALEQRPRRRQPHPVDLVVDRRFLLDVGVAGRDVGLGLVVVVVADEVLDGVVGEEPPELLVELRRQRLVVGHHQGRAVHPGDDLGHGEGLAGAGHAEQRLVRVTALEPGDQLRHGMDLIAAQFEVGDEGEAVERCRHAGPAGRRRERGRRPGLFGRSYHSAPGQSGGAGGR